MNKKLLIGLGVIILIIAAVLIITQSKKEPVSTETIKIGAAVALTGDAASWGEMEKKGIELRLSELENKTVDGKKVEIIYEDTRSTAAGTIAAVQKLVSVDGVKYIIGPTWLDSYPGIQGIIKDKDVLVITPSASATAIQQPEVINNLYSTWYRTDALTSGFAEYIDSQRHEKVAIVFQNDSYYAEFIDFLKADFAKSGINVVESVLLNPGQTDTKTLLTKLKSEGVDGVVFGAYDEKLLTNFLRDQKNILPNASVYSGDAIRGYIENPEYTKLIEGITFFENSSPNVKFKDIFFNKYGSMPTLSASTAYDTMDIFLQLLEQETSIPSMINKLKKSTFDTQSYGPVTFDESNGVVSKNKQYQVQKVINGATERVK